MRLPPGTSFADLTAALKTKPQSSGGGGAVGTGWTPTLAVATDGDRRVLQVTGWTGGTGTAPASGMYVGAAGFVTAIGDAVDIRGAAGSGGSGGGGLTVATDSPLEDLACNWGADGDANGTIYAMASGLRNGAWQNPAVSGALTITTSNASAALAAQIVNRTYTGDVTSTGNLPNSWVEIDYGAALVCPNMYSIQDREGGGNAHMIVNWVLEASNDNVTWDTLHTGTETPPGWSGGAFADFAISTSTFYRYFRWRQVGTNSSGAYYFCPGEIEIYGTLRAGRPTPSGSKGWLTDGSHYIPYY